MAGNGHGLLLQVTSVAPVGAKGEIGLHSEQLALDGTDGVRPFDSILAEKTANGSELSVTDGFLAQFEGLSTELLDQLQAPIAAEILAEGQEGVLPGNVVLNETLMLDTGPEIGSGEAIGGLPPGNGLPGGGVELPANPPADGELPPAAAMVEQVLSSLRGDADNSEKSAGELPTGLPSELGEQTQSDDAEPVTHNSSLLAQQIVSRVANAPVDKNPVAAAGLAATDVENSPLQQHPALNAVGRAEQPLQGRNDGVPGIDSAAVKQGLQIESAPVANERAIARANSNAAVSITVVANTENGDPANPVLLKTESASNNSSKPEQVVNASPVSAGAQDTIVSARVAAETAASSQRAAEQLLATPVARPEVTPAFSTPVGSVFSATFSTTLPVSDSATSMSAFNVPVPVGEKGWGEAVIERVLWMNGQNISGARLQLEPAGLGPLQIHVASQGDQASVFFTSHQAIVREALDQSLPRLRELLESNGVQLVDVNVSDQSAEQKQQDIEGTVIADQGWSDSPGEEESALSDTGVRRPVQAGLIDDYA
jgi:flagellar hook-length control protein FliK